MKKKPPTATFGCEFEFSSPRWEEARDIVVAACKKEYGDKSLFAQKTWFKSKKNFKWHLKTDATTEGELCTPISRVHELPKIGRVIDILKASGLKTTINDSLHVHVSDEDVDTRNIVAAWLIIERTIVKCFPRHRRQKYGGCRSYCAQLIEKRNKKSNIAHLFDRAMEISSEHHSVLSLFHHEKRSTVEFRIAEGTFDKDFVRNWVMFCFSFIEYARSIDVFKTLCGLPDALDVHEMIELMNIKDKPLRRWLTDRYDKFLR